jgi:hypothetical protein
MHQDQSQPIVGLLHLLGVFRMGSRGHKDDPRWLILLRVVDMDCAFVGDRKANYSIKVRVVVSGLAALRCAFISGGPFVSIGTLTRHMADIVLLLGGEKNVPERFRKAFCEIGALSAPKRPRRSWDDKIPWMRGDPEEGDLPLGKEDEAVIRKLIAAALVIEPADRASAAAILAMLQQY